ncbi:MAG: Calx-beta domain-containing protein [Gammaproteobacteria bacterium]
MTSKYAAFAMAAFVAATVSLSAFGEVSLTDQSALRHQQQQLKSNDKPNRGKARPQNPGKATGSQALIDQSGLKWFINTNITFSTSSSASAAASEASYTASVSATTSGGGVVNSTLNDAFDGYNALCISLNNTVATCQTGNANFVIYNKNGAATLDTNPDPNCLNRQVVFPVQTTGTLQLQRKMYVPPNDTFGRWMNIVTNTGAAAQTVTLVVANNLGSDSNTRIVTTSSGDATATTADEWVTTFQNYSGTTSSDPRLAHVLQQTGAPTPLAGINFADGDDNPFWGYTLTLQPGETQIILNFATGQPTKAAAATKAAELASLPAHAQQCMTAAELGQVVNFAPTTINLSVSTNTASEAAATAVTVTATANRAVLSNTTVDLAVTGTGITAGDYTLSNTQITIPAGQSTGTVTFTVVDDAIDEPDETATLTISNPSAGALLGTTTTQDIVITDNDTAGVTVTPTSGLTTTEAGGTATFTVVLTSQPTADVTIALASSDTTEGTVSAPSLTFTNVNWNVAQTVTVTGVDDFVDDGDIAYTINTGPITSTDPLYAAIDPADVAVTNTDDDTASVAIIPLVGTTITTTEAGGTATFTVVLTSQPAANVTIALASSDTSEGTVSPANLTFTPANFSTAADGDGHRRGRCHRRRGGRLHHQHRPDHQHRCDLRRHQSARCRGHQHRQRQSGRPVDGDDDGQRQLRPWRHGDVHGRDYQ